MPLFEDTNPRALKELLGEIHSRTSVLPDFQRDFVWEPGATQELIVSIANAYPAGSILRVRDTRRVFACREFEGAPALNGTPHTFLVLDGQQRLTSLYQAFYGVGEHRYFLDLSKLLAGMDFEEAIFHLRAQTRYVRKLQEFDYQATERVLPLSVLKGGAGQFGGWTRKVARRLKDQERIALEDALDAIEERWIKTIDDYHFPVVTLSDQVEPDALCTIFETLNRTGVKLSVFELLTARFWPHGINLRQLWDQALADHPVVGAFEVDPYYMLQAIALAGRQAPSCKRGDVLNLEAVDINTWWPKVAAAMRLALDIVRDDCRVVLPKWLPYQTMIAPMAASLARAGMPAGAIAGAQREKLKRWFWCAALGQAYESTPNTQSAKDVASLVEWLNGGAEPDTVSEFRFDPKALRDITPRQRAVYRAVICLILANGARDFHSQAVITGKLIEAEGIDDHHLFPANFLKKKKDIDSARRRDCVLNRTLIDRTTNQMISDRAPSDYLAEIRHTPGFPFKAVLDSHCLPSGADSPFWNDDYEDFLEWRQQRLWREIQKSTGVREAADLESPDEEE